MMKKVIFIILIQFSGCTAPKSTYQTEDFTCYPKAVYLFRHAEKQIIKGEDNPELTRAGFSRSNVLAQAMADITPGLIYSSEYTRTQQTVAPLAKQWSSDIIIKTAKDPEAQVEAALSNCNKHVIIAGHSNTIPNLISLFGVMEEITIEDNQYGDLFIIEWENAKPKLRVEQVGE
jgi:phosphohistidine phosphatase SixA|tara:strand:- start:12 stop:536 length:525 start_codon:yes stop_codon:yes gene_type:complete